MFFWNLLSAVFNTHHSMSDDTFAKFFSLALEHDSSVFRCPGWQQSLLQSCCYHFNYGCVPAPADTFCCVNVCGCFHIVFSFHTISFVLPVLILSLASLSHVSPISFHQPSAAFDSTAMFQMPVSSLFQEDVQLSFLPVRFLLCALCQAALVFVL